MIEINGVFYTRKPTPRKTKEDYEASLFMAGIFGMFGGAGKDELCGVDIAEEYGKIQLKKSRLSRRKRNLVVARFENIFEEATDLDIKLQHRQ